MKRIIVATLALSFASIAVAPAIAGDIDLRTAQGVQKFWQDQQAQQRG